MEAGGSSAQNVGAAVKVRTEIPLFDLDSREVGSVAVRNHERPPRLNTFVVLEINGESFAVNASDLKMAIDNALNARI